MMFPAINLRSFRSGISGTEASQHQIFQSLASGQTWTHAVGTVESSAFRRGKKHRFRWKTRGQRKTFFLGEFGTWPKSREDF